MHITLPGLKKEYRPELNGLRALAVLLVLLFHLDFEWIKGGFLGVDVFLVISGYFISRNIIRELQERTFSFRNFYTKRLRRLFPVLIFTLTVVLIVGYYLLTPANFERLGQSTVFSSFSLSNFFFWSESGYFNADSDTKPLLHMWSLSLEEQFYLFWPVLLTIFFKFLRKYLFIILISFIGTSLLFSEIYFSTQPEATFFFIPFRMFEFLLGAACIWLERSADKQHKYLLEFLFITGLLLMIFAALTYDGLSRLPGLLSLIPCLGAMLIIFAGKAPFSSWILKNGVVELLGKASYSIYLIHWPLIVYFKTRTLVELNELKQLILGVISIVLGILMWKFIENTFRYAKDRKRKLDRVWIVVPSAILSLSLFASFIWMAEGVPSRFPKNLYMTKEEIREITQNYWKESNSEKTVLKGVPGKGHIIVFGNSHAIDLIYALRNNGFEAKITSLQTSGKCYNFGEPLEEEYTERCSVIRQRNLQNKNWNIVDAIYLHDHWPEIDQENLRAMLTTIRQLTDSPIFVFGPKMTYMAKVSEIVAASRSIEPSVINDFARKFQYNKDRELSNQKIREEILDPFYSNQNIYYIDLLSIQGGDQLDKFRVVTNDSLKYLYFDGSHLTSKGAKDLGAKLKSKHPYLFETKALREQFSASN